VPLSGLGVIKYHIKIKTFDRSYIRLDILHVHHCNIVLYCTVFETLNLVLKNIVTLKFRLGVTKLANVMQNLYLLLKSTNTELSFLSLIALVYIHFYTAILRHHRARCNGERMVKILLYFYQSYRKNKSGVPLILDHPVHMLWPYYFRYQIE